jgi:hypothetical protein
VGDALRESGSSLTTLGLVHPYRLAEEVVAFVDAAVGVALVVAPVNTSVISR